MHAFIFLVLMTRVVAVGFGIVTPMPNTDVCIKMLQGTRSTVGAEGYGSNTGECIEIKTREPLSSVIEH